MRSWQRSIIAAVVAAAPAICPAQTPPPRSAPSLAELPPLAPFSGLPDPRPSTPRTARPGTLNPGTEGLALPAPPAADGSPTIAILGDLAPQPPTAKDKYLKMAVAQLNLLRPSMVLTVGNLVPGMTRNGLQYAEQAQATRTLLDTLQMPWYPCPGMRDIFSGTRRLDDRRFEDLFKKYQGPLYFSVDAGSVHVIVLDSEEAAGAATGIGDAQLAWLRADLDRVFDVAAGAEGEKHSPWVIVVIHRPLWRLEKEGSDASRDDWSRVHDLLVRFNRRPIVRVEGIGGSTGAEARGPRVVAVIAGGEQAYSMEPTRDGIRYYVLGSTAAMPRLGEDAATAVRGFMLLKFDGADTGAAGSDPAGAVHPAIVELGGEGPASDKIGTIVGDDIVVARERQVLDQIASWGNDVIGIGGCLDQRPPGTAKPAPLALHLNNPSREGIDLSLRMASTAFLASPSRREAANSYVEGFDLPWELSSSHIIRHLTPGQKDGWPIDFGWPGADEETPATAPATQTPAKAEGEPMVTGGVAPPQLEIVVRWSDPRSRMHELVLKRRAPIAPAARIKVARTDALWKNAPGSNAYAWLLRGDEPRKLNPTWQMTADAEKFYVRVQADDGVHSFWPQMAMDPQWGGPASDAVEIAFSPDPSGTRAQRVWLFPFAPKGSELWTLAGQSFQKLDPRLAITAQVEATSTGYEATLALPRKLLFTTTPPPGTQPAKASTKIVGTAFMNISVYDNDEGAQTWHRSWAPDDPAMWGRVDLFDTASR